MHSCLYYCTRGILCWIDFYIYVFLQNVVLVQIQQANQLDYEKLGWIWGSFMWYRFLIPYCLSYTTGVNPGLN